MIRFDMAADPSAIIKALEARVRDLETALQAKAAEAPRRERIANMSSEVVDSNPYSRLMALKRMGIVDNYEVNANVLFCCCCVVRNVSAGFCCEIKCGLLWCHS